MKISICVPIYGVEKYIRRCAISLFEQTYDNIEYVFVNDCSPDNSIYVLTETLKNYPYRQEQVKIVEQQRNRGLACARNKALESSTGDFVLHVDSDDYLEKNTVEVLCRILHNNDVDILSYGLFIEHRNYTKVIKKPEGLDKKRIIIGLLDGSFFHSICGNLIRRSLYTDNAVKAIEGLNMAEDYQVIPRLAYWANKIAVVNIPLYHYDYTNEKSYMHVFSVKSAEQAWQVSDFLHSWFKDKDYIFQRAISHADLERIINNIMASAVCKNYGYFLRSRKRLEQFPKQQYKDVVFFRRIILYSSSLTFIRYYVSFSRMLKHFILFFSSL